MYVRGAAPYYHGGRVGSPVCLEDVLRTSLALETAEEGTITALMVLAECSTAMLSPEDGPEVMAPLA